VVPLCGGGSVQLIRGCAMTVLPRIPTADVAGGAPAPMVAIGGEIHEPRSSKGQPSEGTRAQVIRAISKRMLDEGRETAVTYKSQAAAASEILSTHPRLLDEARADRLHEARVRRMAAKARVRPGNPFENYPQPDWRDGGAGGLQFGLPPIRTKRASWVARQSLHDEDNSPVALLKRALASNFTRVVTLFRQWDVNCDGAVSINELNDAIGALRLADGTPWGAEACQALFAALDLNGNGTIDFKELHAALRQYDPPPLDVSLEATRRAEDERPTSGDKVPTRRPPKPRGVDSEAVAQVKQLLAVHQSRVLDVFRRWDYDTNASIDEHELRRALAALSIPIDAKALKALFRTIDTDESGAISFDELNAVLRRQVDFDNGGNEFFDARTGTYTTKQTAVRQTGQAKPSVTLPAIGMKTSVSVTQMAPHIVSAGGAARGTKHMASHAQDAEARAKFREGRNLRERDEFLDAESQARNASKTRDVHGVS